MNRGLTKPAAFLLTACLAGAGCENLTPGENAALFGGVGGAAGATIARASGMSTAESLATGAAVGAVIAATTYIIAKRQATERQRRIAEQRARAAEARLRARRATAASQGTRKPAKRVPRYIAVDTVKDERTSPRAQKSVMIWDTQSQEIVGNNVYDVESAPQVGSTAKFETYSAEYVGSGS